MANINPVTGGVHVKRFESGGIILIGANTLLNVEAGTLKFKAGLREAIPLTDRGSRGEVLEGDELLTELELDVKFTSAATAGEVWKLLTATGTGGIANQVSITVKIHDRAAVTGESFVFANCFVPPGGLSYEAGGAGQTYDKLKVKLMDNEAQPTVATY